MPYKNFISGKESSPTAEPAEEENIFSKIFGWVKKMISDAIKRRPDFTNPEELFEEVYRGQVGT